MPFIFTLMTGYLLSLLAGLLTEADFRIIAGAPWLAFPLTEGMLNILFEWSLLPIFVIVSITGALKSFGNLIMCEKVNDTEWTQPDMKRIGNGLVADGFCVTVSGLLGGMASDTSASNVAFSAASGATSRSIGFRGRQQTFDLMTSFFESINQGRFIFLPTLHPGLFRQWAGLSSSFPNSSCRADIKGDGYNV